MPWACSDRARAMSYTEERERRNPELRGNVLQCCVWELWFEPVLPKSLFGVEDPTSACAITVTAGQVRGLDQWCVLTGVPLTHCLPCTVSAAG